MMVDTIDNFIAVSLQISSDAVNACKNREESSILMSNKINKISTYIKSIDPFLTSFNGLKPKLYVLPEYFLSSFPMGESIDRWKELAAIEMNGPEYDQLCKIADDSKCFISGNVYEVDTNFSEIYFQTSFVIGPNGKVILRYRRLISLFAPSPYDVWDKYIDHYGKEAIFPVVDTAIGRIGCVASEEILYPEISKCLSKKGMEILCHSTSEVGSPSLTPKEICRRARAIENMCYVVSANSASLQGIKLPPDGTSGMSKIVDYKGLVIAEANVGETYNANAILDIDGLRKARKRTGMTNILSRQPYNLYAEFYNEPSSLVPNAMLKGNEVEIPNRDFFVKRQKQVIEKMLKEGVI